VAVIVGCSVQGFVSGLVSSLSCELQLPGHKSGAFSTYWAVVMADLPCRKLLNDRVSLPPPPDTITTDAVVPRMPSDGLTYSHGADVWNRYGARLDIGITGQRFNCDAELALLPIGMSVPLLSNPQGFDLLDVELLQESDARFYIAIMSKFITLEAGTELGLAVVADKVLLALEEFPTLARACREGRFCFFVATFQPSSLQHSSLAIALEFTKLVASTTTALAKAAVGDTKKAETARQRLQVLATLPTGPQIVASLLVLRRPHLEWLMTPTLSNRLQFLQPTNLLNFALRGQQQSEEPARELSQAGHAKRGLPGADTPQQAKKAKDE
jgi:hypothetical protein